MKEYKRVCKECGKELLYNSYSSFWLAEKNDALCRCCARKKVARRKCDLSVLLEETPETYYWVGFLLADGHFDKGRINFTLAKKDKKQVIKFAKFIGWKGSVKETEIYASVSPMHKDVVNKLCEKFDISGNKTYNPPRTILIHNKELLKYLLIGFIDGDGNIEKQYKRKDCFIRIKTHLSWKNILEEFCKLLGYSINHVKVNKQGYCELYISDSSIITELKKYSKYIPVLERKWNKVDENFVSKLIKSKENKEKILKLLEQGVKKIEISKQLSVSPSLVTKISKEYENGKV